MRGSFFIAFISMLFCTYKDMNAFLKYRRTRQTLWGECTDANLKTVAKRYMIEKK